jgi:hypothetical protein
MIKKCTRKKLAILKYFFTLKNNNLAYSIAQANNIVLN